MAIWVLFPGVNGLASTDVNELGEQVRQLQRQNEALGEQLRRQQSLIESLNNRLNDVQKNSSERTNETVHENHVEPDLTVTGSAMGKIMLSGEGGVAFFNSGSRGSFPNSEFRVDEAKLFLEGPIRGQVYFYTELNLFTHESMNAGVNLGECYLDFENITARWTSERMVNLRMGRLDIPFGEEYLSRDAIDNSLISHSLTDFWGVDEGLELYGSLSKFNYVVAVQNGGLSDIRDFDRDKSVAARIGFEPNRHLHFSVSGMRTGDIDASRDPWSALWFGGAFLRPLDSSYTTKFHADIVQGDVTVKVPRVTLKAFGGYLRYDDNNETADNRRNVYYYSVEGTGDITRKIYAAARFSQILAPNGFPILGNGQFGEYFYQYPSGAKLTDDIWRLTLGLGYRWSENLVGKVEYNFEQGKVIGGASRNHEDLFAIQLAFKF